MTGVKAAMIGVGFLVVIAVIIVIAYFTIWHTAEPRGRLEAREQIVANADFRIFAYNHFFDQCAYIQSQQAKLDSNWQLLQKMEEMGVDESDPDRYWKKYDEVTAITNTLEKGINSYNADSDKEGTRGQFKEVCLPDNIKPQDAVTQAKEGDRITCECEGWQEGPY